LENSKQLKWLKVSDFMAEQFSTCSRKKYCAIILTKNNRLVGMGYNGSPPKYPHCDQGFCPRATSDVEHGSVYDNCIAVHAEANALLWSDVSLRQDGFLIINGPPCFSCAKLIATSGVSTVVCYNDEKYMDFDKVKTFLSDVGINLIVKERNG
jgi:dCMP deaminase